VALAKILSDKLGKEIPPQQVYSMIKNSSKNHPFPTHEAGGRKNLLKQDEALEWWTEKDKRVEERKANAAKKAADKAERATNKSSGSTEAEAAPVAEAE
jgi:hypothetical protein